MKLETTVAVIEAEVCKLQMTLFTLTLNTLCSSFFMWYFLQNFTMKISINSPTSTHPTAPATMYTYSGTAGVDSTTGTDSTDKTKGKKKEITIGDSQEQWLEHPPHHRSLMTGLSVTPYLYSSGGGRGISQV